MCGKNQQIRELFPATFTENSIKKDIYSARRLPDKIHYRLVKCQNCGLIFSSPIFPRSQIANLYRQSLCNYQEQVPYLIKTYLTIIRKLRQRLPKEPKVLEVGCGDGFFLEALVKYGIKDVYGVEPSFKMVALAKKELRKRIKIDVFKKNQFPQNYFDLILCFHTLDHLIDPNGFVAGAFSLLKKGGYVATVVHDTDGLSVKVFGERSPIFDIEHIYLFNKKNLREMFSRRGFEIIDVFNLVNTYPLSYWLRMSGLPLFLKNIGQRMLSVAKLSKINLSLAGGNIGIVARKA